MNENTPIVKRDYPFRNGSQCDRILQYLLAGHKLKNWEIHEKFGVLSHTARISELRKHGYIVAAEQIQDGVWQYHIPREWIKQFSGSLKATTS